MIANLPPPSLQINISPPINEQQQQMSNYFNQQKQKRRPLAFELHCQIREFLPLEKNSHFLQLNHKLSQLCLAKVRRQHQLWKQFRDNQLNFMFNKFHSEIEERINVIELKCTNDDINELFSRLESRINEEMAYDAEKMAELSGQKAVKKALSLGTREKAVGHFWHCWMELYQIWKSSEYRQKETCDQIDEQFRKDIKNIKSDCRPRRFPPRQYKHFPKNILRRLRKEYNLRLAKFEAKIVEIEKARAERFRNPPWMRIFFDWDEKLRKNMKMLIKYTKKAKALENINDLEKLFNEEEEALKVGSKNQ